MNPILKNIIAVIVGIVLGGLVNFALVAVSAAVIPPPAGVDPTNMESLQASIHLFEAKHFVFPFLAHALGTLVGAAVAAMIAASHKMTIALGIGIFYLLGGILAATMIPAPLWFIVLDLVVAYIPMAWIGGKLGARSGS
jgi:hypothetical protein